MRVLLAPQEFKGSLTTIEAVEALADGVRRAVPDAEIDRLPLADGGPGTVRALIFARAGASPSPPWKDRWATPSPPAGASSMTGAPP